MADETILALAADIVTAHVSHNSVSVSDLPTLIQSVFGALTVLGQETLAVEEPRTSVVSVRASVKHDTLICLDCGAKMKMLKR
ncbi:MAG: MucR family transcriptional regulator, partial [Novosphingobium sp. 35-62-5]